jgi:hypothetical protein
MNIAAVRGRLLREPTERELASGTRLVEYQVAVDYEDRATESVEVVWPDPPSSIVLPRQGTEVVAIGRIRRRFFRTANGATLSRTELVADAVLTARQTRQINRRLADLVETMTGDA